MEGNREIRFKIDYINIHDNTLANPLSIFKIEEFIKNANADNMPIKPNMKKMKIPPLDKWQWECYPYELVSFKFVN